MCYIPTKFRVYRPSLAFAPDSPCLNWAVWPLPEQFGDFCRSAKVPYLDLTECFQEAVRQGRMPYAAVDTHWGPEGHALVAERLAEMLREQGWWPAAAPARWRAGVAPLGDCQPLGLADSSEQALPPLCA
jgi:hypothetical protein